MYLQEYHRQIKSGRIIANKKVIKIYDRLISEMNNPNLPYSFDESRAQRPIEFIERFCKQSIGIAGAPLKLELFQKAFIEALFGFIYKDTGHRRFQESLFLVARKNGKALSLDTDINTPNGWVKMKDLNEGDYVYDRKGQPTKITYKSSVFNNHDCYKLTFEDSEEIIADANHLWKVKTKSKTHQDKVLTTEELSKAYFRTRQDGKGIEYMYRVPMNQAIDYEEKDLVIPPYMLGVWLGDGHSAGVRITSSYDDIDEMSLLIANEGYENKIVVNKDRAGTIKVGLNNKGVKNIFLDQLRSYNLIDNKHIPEIYLRSSIEQRQELLRGLMDTDGTIEKRGQCEFSQKNYKFILQFGELLSSLGIKYSIREKNIKCNGSYHKAYSVLFYVSKENSCFKLKRKHERLKDSLNKRMEHKSIIKIEKVDSVPTQCIAVDNDEHLFLAGKRMTVTHNTTMLAAIALYMLIADKEASAECYSVATKQDQAKKTFDEIVAMRKYSLAIQSITRKRRSDLYMPDTLSSFKPLASDSKTLDGLNSHLVIIDELHAIRDRELYEVMRQSMSARRQPLLVMITTAGTVRESIFDDIYAYANSVLDGVVKDDTFLPIMYELDSREEWLDPNLWVKSNPGLATIKQLKYMNDIVERAKNDSKALAGVLVKDFNLRGTTTDSWLSFETINNETTFDISEVSNTYALGGADLSSTTDLTCATLLIVKHGKRYVIQQYFIPSDLVEKKVKEDKVPYDLWIQQGWVTTCEGARVNYSDVTNWFNKMREEHQIYTLWTGYDRWGAQYWVEEMTQNGYQMESVIQGAITMSQPMKELEADLKEGKLIYNNNPVLKWCFTNTQIKSDENDNIRPVKSKSAKQRIDGVVSLIDAYVILHKHYEDYMNMVKE